MPPKGMPTFKNLETFVHSKKTFLNDCRAGPDPPVGANIAKSGRAHVRVRQMTPQRSNYLHTKWSPIKRFEFDLKFHNFQCNRENPAGLSSPCRGFWQDDQCRNQNGDYLRLCLTFLHPIIWGCCCWPVLTPAFNSDYRPLGHRSLGLFLTTDYIPIQLSCQILLFLEFICFRIVTKKLILGVGKKWQMLSKNMSKICQYGS